MQVRRNDPGPMAAIFPRESWVVIITTWILFQGEWTLNMVYTDVLVQG